MSAVAILAWLACSGSTTPPATDSGTRADSGTPADGGTPGLGVAPRYDAAALASGDFYAMPWPSDGRVDADGHPDLAAFPNPLSMPLIDTYLDALGDEQGFGPNTVIQLAFDGPVDTSLLPTAEGSLLDDAVVQLVDIDPDSPDQGSRHPLQWRWRDAATDWYPDDLLVVSPLFGLPLRPATTYAVLVTTDLADPAPGFADDLAQAPHLAPLRDWLDATGTDAGTLAVATVFSTADPLLGMRRANAWVRDQPPVDLSQALTAHASHPTYDVYTGHYDSPVFQEGERPYATEGGGLVFDQDADATPVSWDDMRLSVAVPRDATAPAAGWPVAIYLHGTGGDYLSCCDAGDAGEPAVVLADAGIVVLGIDLPLHGSRGGDDALTGLTNPFNFLNPDSARSILRQNAIDAIYLAHGLAAAPPDLTLPGGPALPIDPDHVFVMGHSQGGLGAALAVPFFGDDVDAVVLSGAGGGMAITLLDRTDPFSLEEALASLLQLPKGEHLDEQHPVALLVQWLSEVTDPLNTAPLYFDHGGLWEGQRPVDLLHNSGLDDDISSYRIAEALAAAARTPVLAPAATSPESWALAGIGEQTGPLSGNATGFDGASVTAALAQWPGEGHGAIFDSAEAAAVYQGFLRSAAAGQAEVPAR